MHPRLFYWTRLGLAAALTLSLSACANMKKKPQYAGTEDGDYITGSPLPDRREGASFLGEGVNRSQFEPIYFAFDSYEVDSLEASKLQGVANFLNGAQGSTLLIIAGFTDERGTDEYNRGLGERRAQAVRAALLQMGADASRIQTTSFGKELPADPGHNEAAWARNRRAEFGVTR